VAGNRPFTEALWVLELAELRLQAGTERDTYELIARLPRTVDEATELTWPAGCRQVEFRRQWLGNKARLLYRARCDSTPPPYGVILAPWQVDGARLTVRVPAPLQFARGGWINGTRA
jgi:hypothetical protein